MAFLIAAAEMVGAAATDLANSGSTISVANAVASFPTTGVLAAGADEVSASIAALFGAHAQAYQALSARAAEFHAQFVQALNAGAGAYASAEAANASPLQTVDQDLLGVISAPAQAVLGRPLIGNGTDAAAGSGSNGGDAGILDRQRRQRRVRCGRDAGPGGHWQASAVSGAKAGGCSARTGRTGRRTGRL